MAGQGRVLVWKVCVKLNKKSKDPVHEFTRFYVSGISAALKYNDVLGNYFLQTLPCSDTKLFYENSFFRHSVYMRMEVWRHATIYDDNEKIARVCASCIDATLYVDAIVTNQNATAKFWQCRQNELFWHANLSDHFSTYFIV